MRKNDFLSRDEGGDIGPDAAGPEAMSPEDAVREARKKALRLLEYADRTEKQLRDKLLDSGFPENAIEDAVEYVRSFHYIDDRRYAENLVRNRAGEKSRFELRHMLEERGVPQETIEDVLEAADISERDTIQRLFRKKYGTGDLTDPALYQKAFRYFSGKGYRYEDIRSALEEAVSVQDE